jgi:hypothetical protein
MCQLSLVDILLSSRRILFRITLKICLCLHVGIKNVLISCLAVLQERYEKSLGEFGTKSHTAIYF